MFTFSQKFIFDSRFLKAVQVLISYFESRKSEEQLVQNLKSIEYSNTLYDRFLEADSELNYFNHLEWNLLRLPFLEARIEYFLQDESFTQRCGVIMTEIIDSI